MLKCSRTVANHVGRLVDALCRQRAPTSDRRHLRTDTGAVAAGVPSFNSLPRSPDEPEDDDMSENGESAMSLLRAFRIFAGQSVRGSARRGVRGESEVDSSIAAAGDLAVAGGHSLSPSPDEEVDHDTGGQRQSQGGFQLPGPEGRASLMSASTVFVLKRVEEMEPCPIGCEPMLDPVELVHEDEHTRVGSAPHVISRAAAQRWLEADPLQRCPLCRVPVVRLAADTPVTRRVAESVKRLAGEEYSGGDTLAHKAVKLLDPSLLSTLVRELSLQEARDMLEKPNESDFTPVSLLKTQALADQQAFLSQLPASRSCPLAHSKASATHGGSTLWAWNAPTSVGQCVRGSDGSQFTLLETWDASLIGGVCSSESGNHDRPRWGSALALRLHADATRHSLCVLPIIASVIPKRDAEGGYDEEVFLPAISVSIGSTRKLFASRIAARRGIWIGSTVHFDDFILPTIPSAAAVILYDVVTHEWQVHRVGIREETLVTDCPSVERVSEDGDRYLAIAHDCRTTVRIRSGPLEDVVLQFSFTPRRRISDTYGGRAHDELSCGPTVTLADAQRLRERLVLAQLEVTHATNKGYRVHNVQLGAIVSNFVIGRGEGCSLTLASGVGVSRCHCVLELLECDSHSESSTALESSHDLSITRLVAYDDGSCNGTKLVRCGAARASRSEAQENDGVADSSVPVPPASSSDDIPPCSVGRVDLGIGPAAATEVREGDSLRLGTDAHVRLLKVSPVLKVSDSAALAAFYERLGDRDTAQTLRYACPQQSERILSQSISVSMAMLEEPVRDTVRGRWRRMDTSESQWPGINFLG